MEVTPPKRNSKDAVHATLTALTGSIPVAGAATSELFKWLVTPSLEKRRDEWMEAVATKLKEHESKIGGLESLKSNDQFQDSLIRASRIALSTSHAEKKDALKNAVINSALPNPPEPLTQEIFLNFVDVMNVWHLKILKLAQFPRMSPGGPMGSINQLIERAFPELKYNSDLYKYIWMDLIDKGLIKRIEMGAFGGSLYDKKTTSFGDQFLTFIETSK